MSERVSESGETECVKFKKSPIRNRVLETRFPSGFYVGHPRHIKIATSHTTRNRVSKTRFTDGCQVHERHIKFDPNIKTKSLRLGLQAQNRVS